jgi:hypothetical protein
LPPLPPLSPLLPFFVPPPAPCCIPPLSCNHGVFQRVDVIPVVMHTPSSS